MEGLLPLNDPPVPPAPLTPDTVDVGDGLTAAILPADASAGLTASIPPADAGQGPDGPVAQAGGWADRGSGGSGSDCQLTAIGIVDLILIFLCLIQRKVESGCSRSRPSSSNAGSFSSSSDSPAEPSVIMVTAQRPLQSQADFSPAGSNLQPFLESNSLLHSRRIAGKHVGSQQVEINKIRGCAGHLYPSRSLVGEYPLQIPYPIHYLSHSIVHQRLNPNLP